jgi:glycosyltransferase involved in cell wall biosynthesis
VVINSNAQRQLSLSAGVSSTIIPNVMDFDNPPPVPDDYAADLRDELGIQPDEYLLLQPTRVVPRKRIEHSIELARCLGLKCVLLVSHEAGDEGHAYQDYLQDYADLMGVRILFAPHRFRLERARQDGVKIYSLADAYYQACLVTYPSLIEGFGNAFLEAVYYRRPIFMNSYVIFKTDIQPKGFRFITFADYLDQACVERVRQVLLNPNMAQEMVDHNYELVSRHFSYTILENHLRTLLLDIEGLGA